MVVLNYVAYELKQNPKMKLRGDIPWTAEVLRIPRDGSCFFASIAMAMNDSIDTWRSIDALRIAMEQYWDSYHESTCDRLDKVTPDLVRFMCAENVNDDILETYNVEATFRRISLNVKAKTFITPAELGAHIRQNSTWGDQAALRAFVQSLNFECGVIIFDEKVGGMIRLPEEWTKDKKTYICLQRENNNHYNVLRLCRAEDGDEDQTVRFPLCVGREIMVDLVNNLYGIEEVERMSEIPVF